MARGEIPLTATRLDVGHVGEPVTTGTATVNIRGGGLASVYPTATGGSETITHVSVGTASSGAGQILYSGALNSSRAVSNGIQPQFAANSLQITED